MSVSKEERFQAELDAMIQQVDGIIGAAMTESVVIPTGLEKRLQDVLGGSIGPVLKGMLADSLSVGGIRHRHSVLDLRVYRSRLLSLFASRGGVAPARRAVGTAGPEYAFYKSGDVWTVTWQGRPAQFKNILGFAYIQLLLESPGKPINSFELEGNAKGKSVNEVAPGQLSEVERRLEFAQPAGFSDQPTEILKAARSKGRNRRKSQPSAVRNAIVLALGKIKAESPDAARHLDDAIHTGAQSVYGPGEQIPWVTRP